MRGLLSSVKNTCKVLKTWDLSERLGDPIPLGFVGSNPTPRIQVEIRRDGGGNSALPSDYGETGAASTVLAFGRKTAVDIEASHHPGFHKEVP